MQATCKRCGKPLTKQQITSKNTYCSVRCATQAAMEEKPVEKAYCLECGRELSRRQILLGNKTCSKSCAKRFRDKANLPEPSTTYKKRCRHCGKEFETSNKRMKFCSDECRQIENTLNNIDAKKRAEVNRKIKVRTTDRIDREQAKAQAHGMSYGQWKAQQYLKNIPKIDTRIK